MIHDFALSSVCHSCGISLMQSAVTPTCPGPKPASNTGRHEDSILWDEPSRFLTPQTSCTVQHPRDWPCSICDKFKAATKAEVTAVENSLWDRLRAELNNLGAAYGELPTTIVTPGTWAHHPQESIEWSAVSDPASWTPTITITEEQARERWPEPQPEPKIETADDWWAYKQRMMAEWREVDLARYWESEARLKRLMAAIERLPKPFVPDPATDTLSKAMSRPLSFEPRVGWKLGDCE